MIRSSMACSIFIRNNPIARGFLMKLKEGIRKKVIGKARGLLFLNFLVIKVNFLQRQLIIILELKLVIFSLQIFLKDVEHMISNLFVKKIFRFKREEQANFMILGFQEIRKQIILEITRWMGNSILMIFKNLVRLVGNSLLIIFWENILFRRDYL